MSQWRAWRAAQQSCHQLESLLQGKQHYQTQPHAHASSEHNPIKLFILETQHIASGQRDSHGVMPMSCPQMQ